MMIMITRARNKKAKRLLKEDRHQLNIHHEIGTKLKKRFSDFCLETPFYDDDADLLTAVFLSQEDMNKEELLEDDSEIIHCNDAKKQKRHDKAASLHKYIDKFTARKKSKEEREADILISQSDEEDDDDDAMDEYSRRLIHVSRCMVKTTNFFDYRSHDFNKDPSKKKYLEEMKKYIQKNKTITGSITLAIDKNEDNAIIWDGNHRLSCLFELDEKYCPKYVPVKFIFLTHGEKNYNNEIVMVPKVSLTWPSYLCGCNLGFETNK